MKILVIQTAFIGDVILASSVIESLHQKYPDAQIDFVLRKGNERLFEEHPYLNKIYIWNKKKDKIKNLFRLAHEIRKEKYTYIINLQRFFSSGLLTLLGRGNNKFGFDKNPLSVFFSKRVKHSLGQGVHEIQRNHSLISELTGTQNALAPRLYPGKEDFEKVKKYKDSLYICVAPASVWFTKQFPLSGWVNFLNQVPENIKVYILGSPSDQKIASDIINRVNRKNVTDLTGKLSFLESAALMKEAKMNYVNDSAPLHIASSMNAPVAALFCSTIPEFGFGPLSDRSLIIQTKEKLSCRPCGLHGKRKCPEGHFKCGHTIEVGDMLNALG